MTIRKRPGGIEGTIYVAIREKGIPSRDNSTYIRPRYVERTAGWPVLTQWNKLGR